MPFFKPRPQPTPTKKTKSRATVATLGTSAFLAASSVIGAPVTLSFEGMRLKPYYDSAHIKTVCVGETEYVEDKTYTPKECADLFSLRLGYYSLKTLGYYNDTAKAIITPKTHAAFTDMSYNIGLSAMKKSSMIRLINEGQDIPACNAILNYNKITLKHKDGTPYKYDCSTPNNKVCYGIWKRRLQIHDLCIAGTKE